jgi:glycosyltransferase involved in cell wall biosynthesis
MFVINGVVADTRVVKEASTLAAAGHAVTVLGMWEPGQPRRERIENFEVVRVRADPLRREVASATRAGGGLARLFDPLRQAVALGDYWVRAAWQGARLAPDVCHGHDLSALPAAWAAARASKARLVYDAHELFTEIGRLGRFPRFVFRVLETLLIGRADRIITVNDSIADELAKRYGVARPLVLRNCPRTAGGVPTREQSPLRARIGLDPQTPIVLFQGMFMPGRGLENLVQASRAFRTAHLVFMGWGPLRPELEALARAPGAAGRVHFTDGVSLADLLAYTAGADLGAIPYRNVGLNNYYTSPNKLFEYCAAGVPVVASRFPELVKIVEGMGVGRTFDPESPDDIARVVNALLDDPVALEEVRRHARETGRTLTWEFESRKLLDVYASLAV